MKTVKRSFGAWAALPLATVVLFSAHTPSSRHIPFTGTDLTTSFDVPEKLTAKLARVPVPAAEAFRSVRLNVNGESGRMLVLFAAVIREGRVVAVQESRAFRAQIGVPLWLWECPLYPNGWEDSGYIPGQYYLRGDQLLPGDQFLPANRFLPGDQFAAEMRVGRSSAKLERGAGLTLRGRDALVLGLVPADPGERAAAQIGLLFVSSGDGFLM